MLNNNYKYQNYLRNQIPNFGPLYTSFVVVVEMQMGDLHVFESVCCLDEMAEIVYKNKPRFPNILLTFF
jgi:hypothetical protein